MADRSGFNRYYAPTLGDMVRTGVRAKVECNRCRCGKGINLEMLIAEVGPNYSLFNRRCGRKLLPGCKGWNYFLHDRTGVWLPFRDADTADRWLAG
jgi:hypothetical protein